MKPAIVPVVCIDPEPRADLEAAVPPGETLTDTVETSVRADVESSRMQADFAARCDAALANHERTGLSVPVDVVLATLASKVAARVRQLRK